MRVKFSMGPGHAGHGACALRKKSHVTLAQRLEMAKAARGGRETATVIDDDLINAAVSTELQADRDDLIDRSPYDVDSMTDLTCLRLSFKSER